MHNGPPLGDQKHTNRTQGPMIQFVKMHRDEKGYAVTNVPHHKKNGKALHSPNGHEWGYGGSGPSEFARSIMYELTKDWKTTEAHYQDMKWEFIAKVPEAGGEIPMADIQKWLDGRQA